MSQPVLDASAVLALIPNEPGAERVAARIDGALISTVNLAGVAGYFTRRGSSREEVQAKLRAVPLKIVDANETHALDAAALLPPTRAAGLSLGDRFCLALAGAEQRPVLTADRAWAGLAVKGIEVQLIR